MSDKNPLLQTLLQMVGQSNVITVHRPLVKFTGSLEAAMLLGQLLYWTPRSTRAGWIAKSDAEFGDELCLTRYSVRAGRQRLFEMGIIETDVRKFKGFPTQHYHVLLDKLNELWGSYLARLSEIEQTDCANSDVPLSEIEQTLTETTPEITKALKEEEGEKIEISQDLQGKLQRAGIYVRVFPEIVARLKSGWTEDDVKAILNWMRQTTPDPTRAAQRIVTRIREGTKAPEQYYPVDLPDETDEPPADDETPTELIFVSAADATVEQPVSEGHMTYRQAWQSALGQLQMEMPKASFETWVRPAELIHAQDGIFTIKSQTQHASDWLESRVSSTICRLLMGICNRVVQVKFIVSVETEAVNASK
jgi:hypothetical protein